ncbi:MAG: hypothetical protein ACTSPW_21645 [Promethearchaeota archaeon]
MLKYLTFKQRQFLLVGFTWICVASPYWPDAISFILVITTGKVLENSIYFFVANFLVPPLHITWMLAMTDFLFKEKQKVLMTIFTIEAVIFETVFFSIYFTDYTLIGTRISVFVVEWGLFIDLYLLFSILFFLIIGLLFAKESLHSQNKP